MDMSIFVLLGLESVLIATGGFLASVDIGNRLGSLRYICYLVIIHMLLIALLASKLFVIGGFSSNVGSIFYATVFTCQCIKIRRFGLRTVVDATWDVVVSIFVFNIFVSILHFMPLVGVNDQPIPEIVNNVLFTTVVSLSAFISAQIVLIRLLRRFQEWWGTILAIIAGQAIDSIIFYPLIFHNLLPSVTFGIMLDGYITKLVCAIIFIPAYLFCVRKRATDQLT